MLVQTVNSTDFTVPGVALPVLAGIFDSVPPGLVGLFIPTDKFPTLEILGGLVFHTNDHSSEKFFLSVRPFKVPLTLLAQAEIGRLFFLPSPQIHHLLHRIFQLLLSSPWITGLLHTAMTSPARHC